jgi:hypothetical protein
MRQDASRLHAVAPGIYSLIAARPYPPDGTLTDERCYTRVQQNAVHFTADFTYSEDIDGGRTFGQMQALETPFLHLWALSAPDVDADPLRRYRRCQEWGHRFSLHV